MTKTISARDVEDGIGLPRMWADGRASWTPDDAPHSWGFGLHELACDLTDYQTRAGLLRQLAMWAGDDGEAQAYWLEMNVQGGRGLSWSLHSKLPTRRVWSSPLMWHDTQSPTEALAAIIEHIALDRRIAIAAETSTADEQLAQARPRAGDGERV